MTLDLVSFIGVNTKLFVKLNKTTWTVIVIDRKKISTISLMLALFFNPFGFDFVTVLILNLTGSYATTTGILYLFAALFFGLSIYFSKRNNKLSILFLTIGMFLNPLGYDVAFAYTMSLFGGSFIKADICFYIIAGIFFTVFFINERINPVAMLKNWIDENKIKIKGLIAK